MYDVINECNINNTTDNRLTCTYLKIIKKIHEAPKYELACASLKITCVRYMIVRRL